MKNREIYFAGGCFWGVEEYFSGVPGVLRTQTGYANGHQAHPTYEAVCTGKTGHAETVRVEYQPETIGLEQLLELFFAVIDPVSVNRQGPDIGPQYRTGIFLYRCGGCAGDPGGAGAAAKPAGQAAGRGGRAEEYH